MEFKQIDEAFLDGLESSEEVYAAIDYLKRYEWRGKSFEETKKVFYQKLKGLSIPQIEMPGSVFKSLPLYRARVVSEGEDIHKLETFGSPPTCKLQRANISGFPVFYASGSPHTCYEEILNNEGELYISKWSVNKQLLDDSCLTIVPLLYGNINSDSRWKHLVTSEKLRKSLGSLNEGYKNKIVTFCEEISKLFVLDEPQFYPLTSYISHRILYESADLSSHYFPCIMYPSVKSGHNELNFAFHPLFEKSFLKLEVINHVFIEKINEEKKAIKIKNIGILNEAKRIEWYENKI